jgi:hypothetical protein
MAGENDFQEKRRHKRKTVKITALLKMGTYLNGRGYAKDISVSGMCLVAPTIFQFIKQSQMHEYLGTHIKVMFPSQSLTVNGTLVRITQAKGEGALAVTSTSNDELWQKMCSD